MRPRRSDASASPPPALGAAAATTPTAADGSPADGSLDPDLNPDHQGSGHQAACAGHGAGRGEEGGADADADPSGCTSRSASRSEGERQPQGGLGAVRVLLSDWAPWHKASQGSLHAGMDDQHRARPVEVGTSTGTSSNRAVERSALGALWHQATSQAKECSAPAHARSVAQPRQPRAVGAGGVIESSSACAECECESESTLTTQRSSLRREGSPRHPRLGSTVTRQVSFNSTLGLEEGRAGAGSPEYYSAAREEQAEAIAQQETRTPDGRKVGRATGD